MFNTYEVAVKISLASNAAQVLGLLARQVNNVGGSIDGLNKKLVLAGASMTALGIGGIAALKGPYESAKRLAQASADFGNLNLSVMDNARAFGEAADNAHRYLGSTITGNIKLIQDLHTAIGDLNNSLALTPAYTQFTIAARVQNGGKDVDNLVSNSIKSLEHRGDRVMQSQTERLRELQMQSQVFFATKGRVSPADYFHMSQTGKMAYTLADPEFLYGPMAAYMQAKTGQTAGTASMTALSSLIGGHMTKKAIGFMRGLNLWQDQMSPLTTELRRQVNNDPEVKKLMALTGDVLVQSGGMPDWAATLFAANPNKFTLDVLAPAIRKKYGDMSDEKMAMLITQEFNRNTADDLSFWILNQQKVIKDARLIANSKGYGEAYQAYLKTPEGAEEALSASWENLKAVAGKSLLPIIVPALNGLAKSLDWIGGTMQKYPPLADWMSMGFTVLAATAAIGGPLLLAAGAIKMVNAAIGAGGLATGIGGVATALKVLGGAAGGFMAAYTGWQIGAAAGNAIDSRIAKKSDYSTSSLRDWLHETWFGKKTGWFDYGQNEDLRFMQAPSVRGPQVTPAPIQVTTNVHLDGRRIAEVVTEHQSREASRPYAGASGFDPSMGLAPIALDYAP